MRVHHALRFPGGPGRVIDRDHLLFVIDTPVQQGAVDVVRGREEVGVQPGRDPLRDHRPRDRGVGDLDHLAQTRDGGAGGRDGSDQFGVDEQQARPGMLEDVLQFAARQSRVQRDEDATCEGHREVGEQHLGGVRAQEGNAVAGLDPASQDPGESLDLVAELAIAVASVAVNDGDPVREHGRRALEEAQRTERCVVRGREGRSGHWKPPRCGEGALTGDTRPR